MVEPAYNKNTGWNYDPIAVEIKRITLSESTPVYTVADLKANSNLAYQDGILVWNGKKKDNKTYDINISAGKGTLMVTGVKIGGLYYQKVFNLPNGKTVVKKITLRPGMWNAITKTYTSGGKKYTEYAYMFMKTKAFDYAPPRDYQGTPGKMAPVELNGDDADWSGEKLVIRRGNFTGVLPSLF